jgi:hypothetical protein
MKATVFGLFGGTVFAFVFWSVAGRGLPAAAQQRESVYRPAGELIALSTMVNDDTGVPTQQIAVVDPHARTMSVYHVNGKTSAITLKSSRNISHDLDPMLEFNAAEPTPKALRATLQR